MFSRLYDIAIINSIRSDTYIIRSDTYIIRSDVYITSLYQQYPSWCLYDTKIISSYHHTIISRDVSIWYHHIIVSCDVYPSIIPINYIIFMLFFFNLIIEIIRLEHDSDTLLDIVMSQSNNRCIKYALKNIYL